MTESDTQSSVERHPEPRLVPEGSRATSERAEYGARALASDGKVLAESLLRAASETWKASATRARLDALRAESARQARTMRDRAEATRAGVRQRVSAAQSTAAQLIRVARRGDFQQLAREVKTLRSKVPGPAGGPGGSGETEPRAD